MDDATLMYSALLALTQQNVTGGGGQPRDITIGYVDMVFTIEIWTGEMITDIFYIVN